LADGKQFPQVRGQTSNLRQLFPLKSQGTHYENAAEPASAAKFISKTLGSDPEFKEINFAQTSVAGVGFRGFLEGGLW
jgi:hypothetical protein